MSEGLTEKYYVSRVDGRDAEEGMKHHGCQYFVLDLTHDMAAREAAMRYAHRIRIENPQLSQELRDLVRDILVEKGADEAPGVA